MLHRQPHTPSRITVKLPPHTRYVTPPPTYTIQNHCKTTAPYQVCYTPRHYTPYRITVKLPPHPHTPGMLHSCSHKPYMITVKLPPHTKYVTPPPHIHHTGSLPPHTKPYNGKMLTRVKMSDNILTRISGRRPRGLDGLSTRGFVPGTRGLWAGCISETSARRPARGTDTATRDPACK